MELMVEDLLARSRDVEHGLEDRLDGRMGLPPEWGRRRARLGAVEQRAARAAREDRRRCVGALYVNAGLQPACAAGLRRNLQVVERDGDGDAARSGRVIQRTAAKGDAAG